MNNITRQLKSSLFLFILLLGFNSHSQILSLTQTTDTNSCDGAAAILPEFQVEGQVWTFKKEDGTVLQYGNASSVYDLCVGAYVLSYIDTNGVLINEGFLIGDTTSDPCPFSVSMNVGPDNTEANTCDGHAEINVLVSPTTCTLTWSGGVTNTDSIQTNLCAGFYYCEIKQTGECSHAFIFGFSMGMNENFPSCSGLAATYTRVNTSDPDACDGSILMNATGGTAPYTYTFNRTDPSNLPTSNPLFENLCTYNPSLHLYNSYNITVQDNAGCTITEWVRVYDNTVSGYIYPINATDSCNGEVISVSIMGGTLPYTYLYSNGDTTATTDSLCEGAYTLLVTDALGANHTFHFTINTETNLPLSAYVIPATVSADGLCDGGAEVIANGGVMPYTYQYSNGDSTPTASDLCGGLNTVTLRDATGAEIFISFIVPTPANTASTGNFADSLLLDSIYNDALINCNINFSLIDSASIVYFTILPDDSVNAVWAVYFAGNTEYINSIYQLDSTVGVYLLTLEVYCPDKSLGNYLFASDQIYYNAAYAGINENTNNSNAISIYPNPFNDYLIISLKDNQASEIVITDIAGKQIFSQKFNDSAIKIDMSGFTEGQYIVNVKNDSTVITRKIVK